MVFSATILWHHGRGHSNTMDVREEGASAQPPLHRSLASEASRPREASRRRTGIPALTRLTPAANCG